MATAEPMELQETEKDAAWCIVADVAANGTAANSAARSFEPGARVYCFPPNRGGAYESVKVIGPHCRTGKLVAATLPARELEKWKCESISSAEVLQQIAPPWDCSDVSRDVAEGIAAWKSSAGPWPAGPLREWNRRNAEKHVGPGTWLARLRSFIARLFGHAQE